MFIAKGFDELTREELYEILRARVDVWYDSTRKTE